MRQTEITIITPPVASTKIDNDLVKLTEYLVKTGHDDGSGGGYGLGGAGGYGVEFENDTFMMKPYCWCDGDDCLWCVMNDPKENPNWKKQIKKIEAKFGKECAKWGSAPQFYYKPTGLWIRWYKWIGRDMEFGKKIKPDEWKKIFKNCIKSIKVTKD